MVKVNKDTFQKEVLDEKGTVLVNFEAEWCGPCSALNMKLEDVKKKMKNVKFVSIDVDTNPELVEEFKLKGVPTLVVYKDGVKGEEKLGNLPQDEVERLIK